MPVPEAPRTRILASAGPRFTALFASYRTSPSGGLLSDRSPSKGLSESTRRVVPLLERPRAAHFLAVTAQLALVLLVIRLFRLEESYGLGHLLPLIFIGFVVHAALPLRFRLPFFLLLSLSALAVLFRPLHVVELVGIGMGLIGICHLPVAFAARVVLLLAAGVALVALRAEWIRTPLESLPAVVLPVLGSMFMFRLIIYLYDLRHEKKPGSVWERLSYFFMLPNLCFPLFPVVDYQTYRRTYYDADPLDIYQKGVLWILRGATHLLLYRVIYYYVVPAPSDVQDLGGVVLYMVATYLLYLRISGQFHLIVGVLCLFGFNLPETHHLYLLASSFSDYWRRINIYWKDFMMKIFYYTVFMKLRRWGMVPAMAMATALVFPATWLLHSYQWLWLRGTFPLTAPDALFWGILGTLVVANAIYEAKTSRKRSLGQQAWTFRGALTHSLKTLGMFLFICAVWSLWSSTSVSGWVKLVSMAGRSGVGDFGLLLAALAALVGIGVLAQYLASRGWKLPFAGTHPPFGAAAVYTSAVACLLVVLGLPQFQGRMSEQASALVASLQEEKVNRADEALLERGYYDGLLDMERYTSALAQVNLSVAEDWASVWNHECARLTGDDLVFEFTPSCESPYKGAPLRTNRWGMRDKDYEEKKQPQTYRIALVGASYTMGVGVEREQTFEALLEDRLNLEHAGTDQVNHEILNFAVGGYCVMQNVLVCEEKVFPFEPDLMLYTAHSVPSEMHRLALNLNEIFREGRSVHDPFLAEIVRQSGAGPGMERVEIEGRLTPYAEAVIQWAFQRMGEACRKRGVTPVYIYVPTTTEPEEESQREFARMSSFARQSGFVTLSLGGAYGSYDRKALRIAAWDTHANVLGHRLLADRLYQVLRENEQALNLKLSGPGPDSASPHVPAD